MRLVMGRADFVGRDEFRQARDHPLPLSRRLPEIFVAMVTISQQVYCFGG